MNGVHDMGGMHGLGPIAPEPDEPVFHEAWEARVLALTLAAGAWGRWNLDASRHQRELIPGPDYLRMSYYEKWITGLEALMIDTGLVTDRRNRHRTARPRSVEGDTTSHRRWRGAGHGQRRDRRFGRLPPRHGSPSATTFGPGTSTRPAIRACRATPASDWASVTRSHGAHVFPDTNAHGHGEQPQPLYQVRFEAAELWGRDTADRSAVYLDLWEDYLEPA